MKFQEGKRKAVEGLLPQPLFPFAFVYDGLGIKRIDSQFLHFGSGRFYKTRSFGEEV